MTILTEILQLVMVVPVVLISYAFVLVMWGWPGLVVAGVGWLLSKGLHNFWTRAGVRSGLLPIAFAPTFYGHAGLAPASFSIFRPPVAGTRDWVAVASLLLCWALSLAVFVRRRSARRVA